MPDYRHDETDHTVHLEPRPDGTFIARIGEEEHTVSVQESPTGELLLTIDGRRVRAFAEADGDRRYIALMGRIVQVFEMEQVQRSAARRGAAGAVTGDLTSQMPGQILEVTATEGGPVTEGETLIVMEAMKMELRIAAPFDGTVAQVRVTAGETVERGQLLAVVEPID